MLNKGDLIFISCSRQLDPSTFDEATFRGFLYSPSGNMSVVWSAKHCKKLSSQATELNQQNFAFSTILIKTGQAFKESYTSKVVIPTSGVYYFTFRLKLIENPGNKISLVFLLVNERKKLEISSNFSDRTTKSDICERSILLQLTVFSYN